jgi:uncharacterized protein YjbI with pentapeptide repeats
MATGDLVPPRIEPVVLNRLDVGDPAQLAAHASLEGLEFTAVDAAGRDLAGFDIRESAFIGLGLHDADLRGARFVECVIERLDAPALRAARSVLRDVVIRGSRVGSAELYESEWQGVHVVDSKLGYVNLRNSVLRDIRFENCSIDELDLGGAAAERVSFVDCRAGRLEMAGARLKHVDLRGLDFRGVSGFDGLRGATVSTTQVIDLAPLFAADFGMLVD